MSTHISQSSLTIPVVESGVTRRIRFDGREKTVKVLVPSHQLGQRLYMPQKRTLNMDLFPNAFNNNGQSFTSTIRRGDIDKAGHIALRMTVATGGSPNVYNSTPYWFSRIDVRTASDNQLICTTYSDTMFANILSKTTKGRQRALFKDINVDSSDSGYLGLAAPTPVGTSTFHLPLYFSGFFESMDLYLADSKADLNFVFYPAQSGIIASGSGTVQLTSFQFLVESNELKAKDIVMYKSMYSQYSRETNFLDPVLTTLTNRTLTAGSVNYFDMSNVNGVCSHQLILVRPTGAVAAGNGFMRYLNLGDNEGAAIDLVDPAQTSIYGAGTPVQLKYLRNHLSIDSTDSDWIAATPAYILSYSENFSKALSGVMDGGHVFDGSRQQIALTLPGAPVAEVQSIVPSAAVSSGSYRFLFRGQLSPEVAYNATPAQMSAAFAVIKPVAARFVTAAFSQALSAGGAVTATFSHPQTSGLEGELVQIVGNGTPSCATSTTVAGTAGVATGIYDVSIYSFIYRTGSFVGGVVRSNQLASPLIY